MGQRRNLSARGRGTSMQDQIKAMGLVLSFNKKGTGIPVGTLSALYSG